MPESAVPTAEASALFSLGVAPSGRVHACRGGAFGHPLAARTAEKIEAAFARGPGHGLLHLGVEETSGQLGAAAGYWRDLAKLFVTKLRTILDPDEAVAKGLEIPLEGDEAASLLAAAPPMLGIEYLSEAVLRQAWGDIQQAFLDEVRASGLGADSFLKTRNPLWSTVGRVFFHLAENKARPDLPFAFLATYTSRISAHGKVQHVPLGRAVQEQAAAANKDALLALLVPVKKAAEKSELLTSMAVIRSCCQPTPCIGSLPPCAASQKGL